MSSQSQIPVTAKPNWLARWVAPAIPYVQYLYFIRFSVLLGFVLIGLRFLGTQIAPTMFRGLLVLEEPVEITFVSWLAFQVAWLAMTSTRLTLYYGPERFGVAPPFQLKTRMSWWHLILWALPAVPLLAAVVRSSPIPPFPKLFSVFVGLVFSILVLFIAGIVFNLFFSSTTEVPDFLFPNNKFFQKAFSTNLTLGFWQTFTTKLIKGIPYAIGSGYFDYKNCKLYSGHSLALCLLIVQTSIYFSGYVLLSPDISRLGEAVPALAYLLVLMLTAGLLFTGVAFLLDMFRVPVLITALVWAVGVYALFDSDHYYRLQPTKSGWAGPELAVDGWAKRTGRRRPLVVVAASGGGIQAAAWTARVLTGLQDRCGANFGDSIALVSSVSGGTVGSLFFVNEFSKTGAPRDHNSLEEIVTRAERSTLNATGWGLVYPDSLRLIVPGFVWDKTRDRGWAMEQSWARDWSGATGTTSGWKEDLRHFQKPAVIFNATLSENGARFILTNFDSPQDWATASLNTLYPDHDISLTSAARLSATFPYVTPMSRPLFDSPNKYPKFHVGDGGYYDNFGVVSAVQFLKQMLPYYKERYSGKSVLFIEIQASPRAGELSPQNKWGYAEQAVGPISTLLNVRSNAQLFRNEVELELLRKQWENAGGIWKGVVFAFKNPNPPLSWHMTPREKIDINKNWSDYQAETASDVAKVLNCSER